MEPLRGGMLAKTELPAEVERLWNSYDIKRTPAQWAFKYLWNREEVGLVLSGMNTIEQVAENIKTASESTPNSLTDKEIDILDNDKKIYDSRMLVNCTNCRYCMPCPTGVNIPENFRAYNHASLFNDEKRADHIINTWMKKEQRASSCVQCGQCEEMCPQNIEIIKHLAIIAEKYEN